MSPPSVRSSCSKAWRLSFCTLLRCLWNIQDTRKQGLSSHTANYPHPCCVPSNSISQSILLSSSFFVELLPQDTTHLIQRPCYQRGSPCQDPAGNWTTQRPPNDCEEMQTAVVWSCFPFIRSGQNHLARHSERGKKTRQTEEEVGRQHQEIDRPGVL